MTVPLYDGVVTQTVQKQFDTDAEAALVFEVEDAEVLRLVVPGDAVIVGMSAMSTDFDDGANLVLAIDEQPGIANLYASDLGIGRTTSGWTLTPGAAESPFILALPFPAHWFVGTPGTIPNPERNLVMRVETPCAAGEATSGNIVFTCTYGRARSGENYP